MRWYVEVSRVGDSAPAERYCVEAKAWQAALQDTRKLRGDAGPLSKFSIELLDDGYRAVDPVQKIRYLVNQAPADAPLVAPTVAAASPSPVVPPVAAASPVVPPTPLAAGPSPVVPPTPVAAPPSPEPVVIATISPVLPIGVSAGRSADPALASAERATSRATESLVPRPGPPRPTTVRVAAEAPRPSGAAPGEGITVPRAAPLPEIQGSDPEPAPPRSSDRSSVPPTAAAGVAPSRQGGTVSPTVPSASKAPSTPPPSSFVPFELLRRRSEEPTPRAPITYREEAYLVASGTARDAVEALLRDRLGILKAELFAGPPGKLVQLAVFDHGFTDKPLRPPLGTLAWKDWRGDPVIGFPAFGDSAPPISSRLPPPPEGYVNGSHSAAPGSVPPPAIPVRAPAPSVPPPAASAPSVPPPAASAPSVPPPAAPAPSVPPPAAPAPSVPPPAALAPLASPLTVAAAVAQTAPIVTAPPEIALSAPVPTAPGQVTTAPAAVVAPPAVAGASPSAGSVPTASGGRVTPTPSAPRASRPKLIVPRRRAGEDLISELFEVMHDLNFARNIAIGAEFVAEVLGEVIPSDVLLIQIFDINTRKFVVVRARGAGAEKALLHSTPDNDPKIVEIMRRQNARVERPNSAQFKTGRWSFIDDEISQVLAGPVRQGGRYLGLIEIANPLGGDPFHQTEINALDYICAQFADFVASRPIVLDADVILGRP